MCIFIETLRGIYDIYVLAILIIIGIFLIYVDIPRLKKAQLKKEIIIARAIARIYVVGGIIVYVLLQIG
ncbi:MAG: hypothetical protein LR001_05755 [Clostridiales bacterium]|nr:hypothetical protein [Clostridiales bacterium]